MRSNTIFGVLVAVAALFSLGCAYEDIFANPDEVLNDYYGSHFYFTGNPDLTYLDTEIGFLIDGQNQDDFQLEVLKYHNFASYDEALRAFDQVSPSIPRIGTLVIDEVDVRHQQGEILEHELFLVRLDSNHLMEDDKLWWQTNRVDFPLLVDYITDAGLDPSALDTITGAENNDQLGGRSPSISLSDIRRAYDRLELDGALDERSNDLESYPSWLNVLQIDEPLIRQLTPLSTNNISENAQQGSLNLSKEMTLQDADRFRRSIRSTLNCGLNTWGCEVFSINTDASAIGFNANTGQLDCVTINPNGDRGSGQSIECGLYLATERSNNHFEPLIQHPWQESVEESTCNSSDEFFRSPANCGMSLPAAVRQRFINANSFHTFILVKAYRQPNASSDRLSGYYGLSRPVLYSYDNRAPVFEIRDQFRSNDISQQSVTFHHNARFENIQGELTKSLNAEADGSLSGIISPNLPDLLNEDIVAYRYAFSLLPWDSSKLRSAEDQLPVFENFLESRLNLGDANQPPLLDPLASFDNVSKDELPVWAFNDYRYAEASNDFRRFLNWHSVIVTPNIRSSNRDVLSELSEPGTRVTLGCEDGTPCEAYFSDDISSYIAWYNESGEPHGSGSVVSQSIDPTVLGLKSETALSYARNAANVARGATPGQLEHETQSGYQTGPYDVIEELKGARQLPEGTIPSESINGDVYLYFQAIDRAGNVSTLPAQVLWKWNLQGLPEIDILGPVIQNDSPEVPFANFATDNRCQSILLNSSRPCESIYDNRSGFLSSESICTDGDASAGCLLDVVARFYVASDNNSLIAESSPLLVTAEHTFAVVNGRPDEIEDFILAGDVLRGESLKLVDCSRVPESQQVVFAPELTLERPYFFGSSEVRSATAGLVVEAGFRLDGTGNPDAVGDGVHVVRFLAEAIAKGQSSAGMSDVTCQQHFAQEVALDLPKRSRSLTRPYVRDFTPPYRLTSCSTASDSLNGGYMHHSQNLAVRFSNGIPVESYLAAEGDDLIPGWATACSGEANCSEAASPILSSLYRPHSVIHDNNADVAGDNDLNISHVGGVCTYTSVGSVAKLEEVRSLPVMAWRGVADPPCPKSTDGGDGFDLSDCSGVREYRVRGFLSSEDSITITEFEEAFNDQINDGGREYEVTLSRQRDDPFEWVSNWDDRTLTIDGKEKLDQPDVDYDDLGSATLGQVDGVYQSAVGFSAYNPEEWLSQDVLTLSGNSVAGVHYAHVAVSAIDNAGNESDRDLVSMCYDPFAPVWEDDANRIQLTKEAAVLDASQSSDSFGIDTSAIDWKSNLVLSWQPAIERGCVALDESVDSLTYWVSASFSGVTNRNYWVRANDTTVPVDVEVEDPVTGLKSTVTLDMIELDVESITTQAMGLEDDSAGELTYTVYAVDRLGNIDTSQSLETTLCLSKGIDSYSEEVDIQGFTPNVTLDVSAGEACETSDNVVVTWDPASPANCLSLLGYAVSIFLNDGTYNSDQAIIDHARLGFELWNPEGVNHKSASADTLPIDSVLVGGKPVVSGYVRSSANSIEIPCAQLASLGIDWLDASSNNRFYAVVIPIEEGKEETVSTFGAYSESCVDNIELSLGSVVSSDLAVYDSTFNRDDTIGGAPPGLASSFIADGDGAIDAITDDGCVGEDTVEIVYTSRISGITFTPFSTVSSFQDVLENPEIPINPLGLAAPDCVEIGIQRVDWLARMSEALVYDLPIAIDDAIIGTPPEMFASDLRLVESGGNVLAQWDHPIDPPCSAPNYVPLKFSYRVKDHAGQTAMYSDFTANDRFFSGYSEVVLNNVSSFQSVDVIATDGSGNESLPETRCWAGPDDANSRNTLESVIGHSDCLSSDEIIELGTIVALKPGELRWFVLDRYENWDDSCGMDYTVTVNALPNIISEYCIEHSGTVLSDIETELRIRRDGSNCSLEGSPAFYQDVHTKLLPISGMYSEVGGNFDVMIGYRNTGTTQQYFRVQSSGNLSVSTAPVKSGATSRLGATNPLKNGDILTLDDTEGWFLLGQCSDCGPGFTGIINLDLNQRCGPATDIDYEIVSVSSPGSTVEIPLDASHSGSLNGTMTTFNVSQTDVRAFPTSPRFYYLKLEVDSLGPNVHRQIEVDLSSVSCVESTLVGLNTDATNSSLETTVAAATEGDLNADRQNAETAGRQGIVELETLDHTSPDLTRANWFQYTTDVYCGAEVTVIMDEVPDLLGYCGGGELQFRLHGLRNDGTAQIDLWNVAAGDQRDIGFGSDAMTLYGIVYGDTTTGASIGEELYAILQSDISANDIQIAYRMDSSLQAASEADPVDLTSGWPGPGDLLESWNPDAYTSERHYHFRTEAISAQTLLVWDNQDIMGTIYPCVPAAGTPVTSTIRGYSPVLTSCNTGVNPSVISEQYQSSTAYYAISSCDVDLHYVLGGNETGGWQFQNGDENDITVCRVTDTTTDGGSVADAALGVGDTLDSMSTLDSLSSTDSIVLQPGESRFYEVVNSCAGETNQDPYTYEIKIGIEALNSCSGISGFGTPSLEDLVFSLHNADNGFESVNTRLNTGTSLSIMLSVETPRCTGPASVLEIHNDSGDPKMFTLDGFVDDCQDPCPSGSCPCP